MLRKLIGFIHPRIAVVVHDLGMVWLAWMVANGLRYALLSGSSPSAGFL